MSDEYQFIMNNPLPDQFFTLFANKINATTIFHAFDIKPYSICCIYQNEIHNTEILRWGGNFSLYYKNKKIFLTINSGNITEIKTVILKIFQQLNIDFTLEISEE